MSFETVVSYISLAVGLFGPPIACGMIATKRGHRSSTWVWRGLLLGIFGVIWACFLKDRSPKPEGITLDMPLPPSPENGGR